MPVRALLSERLPERLWPRPRPAGLVAEPGAKADGARRTGAEADGDRADGALPEVGPAAARHRTAWRGVLGALAAFVVLAVVNACSTPVYAPADEASHVGYASMLASGDGLPTIDTPIPIDGDQARRRALGPRSARGRTIWTANHPPLYYALAAVPIAIGARTGNPLLGVRAARLLSVALAAAGLLLLGWLLLLVLPDRPRLAVAATGVVALIPTVPASFSIVYNDAMSFLAAVAALAAATVFLLRGPSATRLAAVAATASAAALVRASGLLVVGVAGLAVLLGAWRAPGRQSVRARLLRAVAWAAPVGAAVVATAGWFYLRNVRLYGDITGTAALMERLGRPTNGNVVGNLLAPWDFWAIQQRRLWDVTANLSAANGSAIRMVWLPFLAVPVAGLALGGVRLAWRLAREPGRRRIGPWRRVVAVALWFLLLGLTEVSVAQFRAAGGNAHARYIFPALAAFGLILAAGLAALPGARRGLPTLAMLAALAAVNVWGWLIALGVYYRTGDGGAALRPAFEAIGVSQPALVLAPAGVAFALALAVLGQAVWSLGGAGSPARERAGSTSPGAPLPVGGRTAA